MLDSAPHQEEDGVFQKSDQLNELGAALAKAQGEIKHATKDTANPFFKSKYADLAACKDVCREPLARNGLSVVQIPGGAGSDVVLTTVLLHASGQWIASDMRVRAKDDGPQAVGSALTYCRRYGLCAMVGIATEDDDGNSAQSNQGPGSQRPAPARQGPPPGPPRPPQGPRPAAVGVDTPENVFASFPSARELPEKPRYVGRDPRLDGEA